VTSDLVGDQTERQRDAAEGTEVIPSTIGEPRAPRSMSGEDVEQLRREARELVEQLAQETGGRELALLDDVTNVGLATQQQAGSQMSLLNSSIGALLDAGGPSKDIANGLRDLRLTLNAINPQELTQHGVRDRLARALPFGGRHNPLVRRLNKIALRYEPASRQAAEIEAKLRDGRALLARDNVELRQMYEDVEEQQLAVQRGAYGGELLMQQLDRLLKQTDDAAKRERMRGALHDVAMRIQDLRTIEEVHAQYFVSIELTRQNNNRLGQSVERTLALATNVVTVGLAVQAALVRQQRVADAAQRTREFLGDLVATNAATIRQHTLEIGDLYRSPVIAMEKLAQAHGDLLEALDAASRQQQEGTDSAREGIARLTEMSADLEQRVGGLLPAGEVGDRDPASPEESDRLPS
jgi:uncharacterized protein YaaN involved in tellurite resistance